MSKNMARHLRLKHIKVYRQMQHYLETKNIARGPRRSTSWVKGSWAKKYCHKVSEGKYRCNICDAVLSLAQGLFGNMKRHIKSKHPYVYAKEIDGSMSDEGEGQEMVEETVSDNEEYLTEFIDENKVLSKKESSDKETSNDEAESESDTELAGDEFLNENDPDFETKVKYLVTKPILGRKRAKKCFWNFFNVIEENHVYSCLACNKRVAIFPHSIANMKRHIRVKHKKQHQIMMKYMAEESDNDSPISFDKYYFESEGENNFKCKECDEVIQCCDEEQQALFDHIKDSHPDQILAYQEETSENVEGFDVSINK